MDIKPFLVEEWMNAYENDAAYNLAETCVDSLTLGELLTLSGQEPARYLTSLADQRLTYGHISGSPALLCGIGSLFCPAAAPEQIVVTHGAAGANHQLLISLLGPKDHAICFTPAYQQHTSIPESTGAQLSTLPLLEQDGYMPDLEKLKTLFRPNTKLVIINSPNNPTGALFPDDVMKELVDIARRADVYLLNDEVYRGITLDGSYTPSVVDLYEKGISVGSMSKVFSLAGLRLGFIVSKDAAVIEACKCRRDYDTISCGVLDDMLAALALQNKEAIWQRGRDIVRQGRDILTAWVSTEPRVRCVTPQGGSTALVHYNADLPSRKFCLRLLRERGVLYTPGDCFELEYCYRIGYAFSPDLLQKGLEQTSAFLASLPLRAQF